MFCHMFLSGLRLPQGGAQSLTEPQPIFSSHACWLSSFCWPVRMHNSEQIRKEVGEGRSHRNLAEGHIRRAQQRHGSHIWFFIRIELGSSRQIKIFLNVRCFDFLIKIELESSRQVKIYFRCTLGDSRQNPYRQAVWKISFFFENICVYSLHIDIFYQVLFSSPYFPTLGHGCLGPYMFAWARTSYRYATTEMVA